VVADDGQEVDLGQVGELVAVDDGFVRTVIDDGLVPVVSSVARGEDGLTYNINADTAAAALAVQLSADKLVVLTDVPGLYADWPDESSLVSEITASDLRTMVPTLQAGMIPKMTACLSAVEGGVERAHVLDGRVPHALLLEVFTDAGVGTLVVADPGEGGGP
jgi:acetylglutamate kinase